MRGKVSCTLHASHRAAMRREYQHISTLATQPSLSLSARRASSIDTRTCTHTIEFKYIHVGIILWPWVGIDCTVFVQYRNSVSFVLRQKIIFGLFFTNSHAPLSQQNCVPKKLPCCVLQVCFCETKEWSNCSQCRIPFQAEYEFTS